MHKHHCDLCTCVWEHGEENRGYLEPHMCPVCTRVQVNHYLGQKPVTPDYIVRTAQDQFRGLILAIRERV